MIADINDLILRQITPLTKLSKVKIFLPLVFCFLAITPARKIIEECWKSNIMILEGKKLLSAHSVLSQRDGFKKGSDRRSRAGGCCVNVFDFSGGMTFTSITTTDKNVSSCFEAVVLVRKIIMYRNFWFTCWLQLRIVVPSTLIRRSTKCFSQSIWNWELTLNAPCTALKVFWKKVSGTCV